MSTLASTGVAISPMGNSPRNHWERSGQSWLQSARPHGQQLMQQQLQQVLPFEGLNQALQLLNGCGAAQLVLPCDLIELPTEYTILAEVTGMRADQLTVSQDGQRVSISYQRKCLFNEQDSATFHSREIRVGRVERSFELPADAQCAKAIAKTQNGLLSISIPKNLAMSAPRLLAVEEINHAHEQKKPSR